MIFLVLDSRKDLAATMCANHFYLEHSDEIDYEKTAFHRFFSSTTVPRVVPIIIPCNGKPSIMGLATFMVSPVSP